MAQTRLKAHTPRADRSFSRTRPHRFLRGTFVVIALAAAAQAQTYDPAQDKAFQQPFIDLDQWRDTPVRHRYVHGGFQGTDARFSIYFPPKEQYQGRFFQYITPTPINETDGLTGSGTGDQLPFSLSSGAYLIVSNEGAFAAMMRDSTLGAYRVNAATAQYSRVLAAQMYGPHRTYGYAYGGSGGAFRTIGGFENARGVWDGVVPYVVGSPQAIPNVFTARLLALRLLKDRFPSIVDALEPGGGGDPYAGLNPEERAALAEVSRLGFPIKSWSNFKTIGMGSFPILFALVIQKDPTYFSDFWKAPGYPGANPSDSLLRARIRHSATIRKVIGDGESDRAARPAIGGVDEAWRQLQRPPSALELDSVPTVDPGLATVLVRSGLAAGASFPLGKVVGNTIFADTGSAAMMPGAAGSAELLKLIRPGDEVQIDNSNFVAVQYFHRYQVPTPDFYVWNQFRGPDGTPLYPQRPKLIGPEFSRTAGGSTQNGQFSGKMILLESLWDQDAFPWQADWYASKVQTALGTRFDDNFRMWFTDRALHGDVDTQADPTHTVSYVGSLQQALRDLSAWVEKGVPPPPSTSYRVVDGQVQVPDSAVQRLGIQPVIAVTANGKAHAVVSVNRPVAFSAVIDLPPNTGRIVSASWDFAGTGDFSGAGELTFSKTTPDRATAKANHAFPKSGTYFVTIRATSQRQGDSSSPYGRIQNLGRVRITVK